MARHPSPLPDGSAAPAIAPSRAALSVHDLCFSYRPGVPVLQSISLEATRGELMMVVGASGSGKSTLLKLMKGLLAPQQGFVLLDGERVQAGGPRTRLDPAVAYIPQQLGLVRSRTVLDNTLMGALGRVSPWRGALGWYRPDTVNLARETLALLGLSHKTGEKVRLLSGGERQRVAIARALVQQPQALIADEFVSQLDPATTAAIMKVVKQVAAMGVTVIMTTHEFDLVPEYADEVVLLRDGQKLLQSPAGTVTPSQLSRMITT